MTRVKRQEDWSFGGLWPYEPCWLDTSVDLACRRSFAPSSRAH
jgi:hypothetical protein